MRHCLNCLIIKLKINKYPHDLHNLEDSKNAYVIIHLPKVSAYYFNLIITIFIYKLFSYRYFVLLLKYDLYKFTSV
jgi:hypothetical protein